MDKLKKMSLDEEMDVTVIVAQLKEWTRNCPGNCPMSNYFKLLIATADDREILKFHLKTEEDS